MSNGISARQNDESSITRLAAQRQLYRDVSRIEKINVIFIVLPIVFSLIQDVAGWAKTASCIIALAILVFSFVLDNWQKDKKILAATIQQEFDVYVFFMDWDCKLFGIRKNLNAEIAKASKNIMVNEVEKETLKNWYRVETDAMTLEDGIAACQKENCSWDFDLRNRYRWFLIAILVIFIVVQIVISLLNEDLVKEFLFRFIIFSPVLNWIIKTISGINRDFKRMESIKSSVYSTNKKTMEELMFTQKYIFENRKFLIKIPDWFYYFFKDNDEDREQRALEIKRL